MDGGEESTLVPLKMVPVPAPQKWTSGEWGLSPRLGRDMIGGALGQCPSPSIYYIIPESVRKNAGFPLVLPPAIVTLVGHWRNDY